MKRIPLLLIAALLLAAFLRLYRLDSLPVSLFGDEIDVGFHSLSLWQTGKSYTGQFLPTYISSVAESRAPLLMYVTAPFVGILGTSNFVVRLAPALFGILGVLVLFYLVKVSFAKEKRAALIAGLSSLFLAVSFWHLHYSRAAFESSLLLFLLILGFTGVIGYLSTGERKFAFLWPALALAFYTYSTATVFAPLLLAITLFIYKDKIKLERKVLSPLLITLVLLIPIVFQIFGGHAGDRFKSISIFGDRTVTDAVELSRTQPWD